MTWNSVLVGKSKSADVKMLIFAFPKTWLLPESLDDIMKVVVWSLGCLMDGTYPRHDHKGNPWPQGSTREFLGGKQLAHDDSRGVFVEARGDWEWRAQCWHLPTASTMELCYKCGATLRGPLAFDNFAPDAPQRASPRRTVAWWFQQPRVSPLFYLPVHLDMFRIDVMHCLCQGVCLWVISPVLLWLCGQGLYGDGPLARQLRVAFASWGQWLHEHQLESSQRVFTPRRLGLGKNDYLENDAKAWNARMIINWLDSESRRAPQPVSNDGWMMTELVTTMNEMFHLSESSPMFFQQHEAAQYHGLVEKGLALYKQLAVNSFRRRVLHFPLRPKLHEWQELGEQVLRDRTNPRFNHCFADEDYLRVVLRAARACPRAAMAGAVLRRWVLKCSLVWSGRCSRWTIVRTRKFFQRRRVRKPVKVHL